MTIPLENQINTILTPVFGDEIYPIVHPDPDGLTSSVSNMYGAWTIVGGQTYSGLAGSDSLSRVRVQVSVYSIDYTEFKATTNSVIDAMNTANELANQNIEASVDHYNVAGALSNVIIAPPQEGFEEDTRRFFSHSEFYVWSKRG